MPDNNPLDQLTTQEVTTPSTPAPPQDNWAQGAWAQQTGQPTDNELGAGIGKAAGWLVNVLGNIFTGKRREKREKEAREYAQMQYQTQLADHRALRDEQNAYNSPKEQRARMASAGLNPHLMYQQGTTGVQSTGASPPSQQSVQPLSDPLASLSGKAMQEMQIQQMLSKAQARNLQADATLKEETMEDKISQQFFDTQITIQQSQQAEQIVDLNKNKITEQGLDIQLKKLNLQVAEDPTSGTSALATLRASLMAIELSFTEQVQQDKIDQIRANLFKTSIDTNIALINERILEQQALLWEKGIKPNATLLEQYTDELIYTIVNSTDPAVLQTAKDLKQLPYLGNIIFDLINNRRKNAGNTPIQ